MSRRNPLNVVAKRSKIKVTSHINIAGVGLCTLVSAGFFYTFMFIGITFLQLTLTLTITEL